jgi:hypothetical protein
VLAGKVGGPTPTGIHVYHSSPHDFDRFDLSKIGTGEGAQVYGHGIYAAENPAVSGQGGQYWGQFLNRFPKDDMRTVEYLKQHGFDRDAAAASLRAEIARQNAATPYGNLTRDVDSSHYDKLRERLGLLESGAPVGPRTYEVNFGAKPEELLDWDKPLAGQPAYQRLREHWDAKIGDPDIIAQRLSMGEAPTGAKLYQSLTGIGRNQPAASAQLNEAGIPGIRYLDEGSRNLDHRLASIVNNGDNYYVRGFGQFDTFDEAKAALGIGKPTHNYVAFDPSRLDIMAKYGVVGGVPLGAGAMGGTIDQSTYGDRQ